MPGFSYAGKKNSAFPTPDVILVLVGKSTQIANGDVLVPTNGSAYTTGNVLVARPLLSGDTVTTSNGLYGVAPYAVGTDSSGNITTTTSPVTVDAKGRINPQLQSIPAALPTDPITGFTPIWIFSFDQTNIFKAKTATNDPASYYLLGRSVGVTASAASWPAVYTVDDDAAQTSACLIVESIDADDPLYNSASGGGAVFVTCKNTFYAHNTNGNFTN